MIPGGQSHRLLFPFAVHKNGRRPDGSGGERGPVNRNPASRREFQQEFFGVFGPGPDRSVFVDRQLEDIGTGEFPSANGRRPGRSVKGGNSPARGEPDLPPGVLGDVLNDGAAEPVHFRICTHLEALPRGRRRRGQRQDNPQGDPDRFQWRSSFVHHSKDGRRPQPGAVSGRRAGRACGLRRGRPVPRTAWRRNRRPSVLGPGRCRPGRRPRSGRGPERGARPG